MARKVKNKRSGELKNNSFNRGVPLESASDTKYLCHPSGDSCETDIVCWEYFQDALAYAEKAQFRDEYAEAARKTGQSPLEAAVFDFFRPPSILDVNLHGYHGKKGDEIIINAFDSVGISDAAVLILEPSGTLLEMGHAYRLEDKRWKYNAAKDCLSRFVKIIVDVWDLPGHMVEERYQKSL